MVYVTIYKNVFDKQSNKLDAFGKFGLFQIANEEQSSAKFSHLPGFSSQKDLLALPPCLEKLELDFLFRSIIPS